MERRDESEDFYPPAEVVRWFDRVRLPANADNNLHELYDELNDAIWDWCGRVVEGEDTPYEELERMSDMMILLRRLLTYGYTDVEEGWESQ